MTRSFMYCEHANECPMTCPCDSECACQAPGAMCGPTPPELRAFYAQEAANERPLRSLANEAFANAKDKGWWELPPDDRLFSEKIALMHSELSEALEEWRNGHALPEIYYGENGKPEGVPIELADVLIRIFDTAAAYGIDLDEAVRIKMKYNSTRAHRHGGKRA